MLSKFFQRTKKYDFVVIDPVFPQKEPFAFRNTEVNEYLKIVDNFDTLTMYPMRPNSDAWFKHGYGVSHKEFIENKRGYLQYYPSNKKRIHYLNKNAKYHIKLAYSFFLAETYTLLPFFETHNIPFVFCLYPGGAFGLNNNSSDNMLKKIFQSKQFKGVIVTQNITRDYLVNKNLCPVDKINFIYGGFVQFKKNEIKPKKLFKKDKKSLDICFVAAKYSEKGEDKGYDLFIDVAKKLCETTNNINFHVIGGFSEDDINVKDIKSRIKFYGYKRPDFLLELYSKMDIFLSPGRPFKIFEGNFDGFPLGIDASFCGTALFVSDELKMNHYYKNDEEIVIIPLNANKIADKILYYYKNPNKLNEVALKGQKRTQHLFDINLQINERLRFFKKFVNLEFKNRQKLFKGSVL